MFVVAVVVLIQGLFKSTVEELIISQIPMYNI